MINLYKNWKSAILILFIVWVATVSVSLFFGSPLSWWLIGINFVFNLYYGIPISLTNGWLIDYQNRRIPWDQSPRKRAVYGVIGGFLVTMGALLVLNLILWTMIKGHPLDYNWWSQNKFFIYVAFVFTLVVTISLHAIGFFQEIQREKLVSAQLRQEKLLSELNVLRSQIDPHFLFNSFNVLSGLIDEDPQKAQEFLSGLSSIYRYTLEQRNDETSKVKSELVYAKQYLKLQAMRFENSIQLKSTIPNAVLERKVPSLSLQLLLENAIKHNSFDKEHPLDIEISAENEHLVIRNNRKSRSQLNPGNGIGLQNIKDRYALLSAKQPIIDPTPDFFTVKLPLI